MVRRPPQQVSTQTVCWGLIFLMLVGFVRFATVLRCLLAGVPMDKTTPEQITEVLPKRGIQGPAVPQSLMDLQALGPHSVLQPHLRAMFLQNGLAVARTGELPQLLADIKWEDLQKTSDHITMGQVSPFTRAALFALRGALRFSFVASLQRGAARGSHTFDEAVDEDKMIMQEAYTLINSRILSGVLIACTMWHVPTTASISCLIRCFRSTFAGPGIAHTQLSDASVMYTRLTGRKLPRQWTHLDFPEGKKGLFIILIALARCLFEYGPAEDRKVLEMNSGDIVGKCVGAHVAYNL